MSNKIRQMAKSIVVFVNTHFVPPSVGSAVIILSREIVEIELPQLTKEIIYNQKLEQYTGEIR